LQLVLCAYTCSRGVRRSTRRSVIKPVYLSFVTGFQEVTCELTRMCLDREQTSGVSFCGRAGLCYRHADGWRIWRWLWIFVARTTPRETRDSTLLCFLRCCALAAASDRVREECVYVHISRDDGSVKMLPFSTASKFCLHFCVIIKLNLECGVTVHECRRTRQKTRARADHFLTPTMLQCA